MSVVKIRMLGWMWGKTRKYRIRNEEIQTNLGVTLIEDKIREDRLRQFGHIRRLASAPVRKCKSFGARMDMSITKGYVYYDIGRINGF